MNRRRRSSAAPRAEVAASDHGEARALLLPALAASLLGAIAAVWAWNACGSGPAAAATAAGPARAGAGQPAAAAGTAGAGLRTRVDDEGPMLTVRVEDRGSGLCLPGARVTCRGSPDITRIADGRGLVLVPASPHVLLVGTSGDRYGEAALHFAPEDLPTAIGRQHRLLLDRDLTLAIRVVDARGTPVAFAPVDVAAAGATGREDGPAVLALAADGAGTVAVAHWQDVARGRQWGRGLADRVRVQSRIAGAEGHGAVVDATDPPPEVLLQLPATGSIAVRAFDDAGPMTGCDLTLQVVPDGLPTDGVVPEVLGTREWTLSVRDDEPAVYPRVALGRRYRAQTRRGSLKAAAVFWGPRRAGEEVAVTLRAALESTVLLGRALDASSAPLAQARLRLVYATEAGSGSRLVTTDAGGRFRVNLGNAAAHRSLRSAALAVAGAGTAVPDAAPAGLVRRIAPRPLPPGDLDLGDLVFEPAPVLASGRILPEGTATDSVDLAVDRRSRREGDARWEPEPLAMVAFPAPGCFEVRGPAGADRYRLRLASRQHLPCEPLEFAPGASGLEIRLQRGGRLRALLRVDPDIRWQDLEVQLRPDAADAVAAAAAAARDRLHGPEPEVAEESLAYDWRSLWPGTYAVEVRAQGSDAVLASAPARVEDAQPAVAPDLDLRGRLRVIRWRVTGTDRQAVPDGPRSLVLAGDDERPEVEPRRLGLQSGSARMVTDRAFADVLVLAEGFLPARLRSVPGDNLVVLEPFPKVAVRVRGGPGAGGPGMALQLVWQRDGGRARAGEGRSNAAATAGLATDMVELDRTGTASVPLALDGCYRVVVYVDAGDRWVGLDAVEPAEIHVAAATIAQSFDVVVAPAALRDALANRSPR